METNCDSFQHILKISVLKCMDNGYTTYVVKVQGPPKLSMFLNFIWGPLKLTKSNFNPVHVYLHFGTFGVVVLQLILASKLSELEQFENLAANGLFTNKIAFYGKWLCPRAKCKKGDPI